MNISKIKYMLCLPVAMTMMLAGCTDDFFADGVESPLSTDAVAFTAAVSPVESNRTRGGNDLYSPLTLTDDREEFPLYLHTYEHPMGDETGESSPSTRGVQVGSAADLYKIHKSFGVKGDYESDGSSFMEMQDTRMLSTGNNRVWTTTVPKRWPGDKRLTFNAIAPFDHLDKLKSPHYSKNQISFSYSAQKSADGMNDAEAQPDLLTAVATMNREESADYNYRIPLKFQHALSAVKFAVRDVLKGKVISISIKNVKGSGDCVYTADSNSDNGKFTWTNQQGSESYTQLFNHEVEGNNFDSENEANDVVLTDDMPSKTFMMIPQMISEDAEIEVEIERYNVVDGLPSVIKVKGKILDNNVKEWKAGYEYIYTISTSKDNWVYVLDADGNTAKGLDNIYVYNPGADEFASYGNNAYFNVRSYRYKANDQNFIEALPWSASHGGSESYQIEKPGDENGTVYPNKFVTNSDWITDTNSSSPLAGKGTSNRTAQERHNLVFLPHYVTTNWEGDKTMQAYEPYSGFSKDNPYDLSTFGGLRSRTTANCYIVDRSGWYMLPLVYGNAIKNGATNASAYTSASNNTGDNYRLLKTMTDYNGNAITGPNISGVTNASRAELVWQDAYNMIDQNSVEIVTVNGERMLRFFVERENLQQGNAIVALTNQTNGAIMWSWHIWATEHWLNPSTRLPHVYNNVAYFNNFVANNVTSFRERGDVAITHNQPTGTTFYMSPYNLGWCDPKRVVYLQRHNQMDFVQYMPDGKTKTSKTDKLAIIQDGETIDYKYANNSYYQWGRKDPMRGFFDHDSHMKAVFGTRPSTVGDQSVTIATAIRNPNVFYGKSGASGSAKEDWCVNSGHSNLWNNHANMDTQNVNNASADANRNTSMWVHTKTIYDPSPAGYMVPNVGVFHFIFTQTSGANITGGWSGGQVTGLTALNNRLHGSSLTNTAVYDYVVYGGSSTTDRSTAVFFSATGNKWWSGDHLTGVAGGDNYNPQLCYLWTSRYCRDNSNHSAYGMALGLDQDLASPNESTNVYYISAHFYGRRAMGRAVRAIREP